MRPPMSTLAGAEMPDSPVVTTVLTAVLSVPGGNVSAALAAARRQVYERQQVAVVGEPDADIPEATERYDSLRHLVENVAGSIQYIWLVHSDARPRPDALGALVEELERTDAAMAGSKLLAAHPADVLESIGSATDVFGDPYTGLDANEVDLEQYDVVRDVAMVAGVSLLVRRDIFKGLSGTDVRLPPAASGFDLSVRARLAGGRVVAVPSSEVTHDARCTQATEPWREKAGRIRVILKTYRLVTLCWVIPLLFLIGLLDGVSRLFLGTGRPLRDWFLGWSWNLVRLPSTIGLRRQVIRHAGDEELFRYQVSGSVRLRQLGADLSHRLGTIFDVEERRGVAGWLERSARTWQKPAAAAAVVAVVAVLVATRSITFSGVPVAGYALPLPPSAWKTLLGYAGGWNPAGLGAPLAAHPSVGATALMQLLLAGKEGATATVATVAALGAGIFGMAFWLRRGGATPGTGVAGGLVYAMGLAAGAVAGSGSWTGLLAMGAVPWSLSKLTGRVGRRGLAFGSAAALLAGALAPLAALAIAIAGASWIAMLGQPGRMAAAKRLLLLTSTALIGGGPYLVSNRLPDLIGGGRQVVWTPPVWWLGLVAAAAVVAILWGESGSRRLALGGCLTAFLGVIALQVHGLGQEPDVAAAILASTGSGAVVAAALIRAGSIWRDLALVPAVLLLLTAGWMIPGGRAGLPADRWSEVLAFTRGLGGGMTGERVLLIGELGSLPGDARTEANYEFRVATAPLPNLTEARLTPPGLGDQALEVVVEDIAAGRLLSPGKALAPFGIRWVVIEDGVLATGALTAQIDFNPVPVAEGITAFENLSAMPRAESTAGDEWELTAFSYRGPVGGGRVRLAENAHPRWGPDWSQIDWANEVSASEGVAAYDPYPPLRTMAILSAGLLVGCLVTAIWPERRRG